MKKSSTKNVEIFLNSLEGIQKAIPRDGLYDKIEKQLEQPIAIIPLKTIRWVAVAASFLLLLNIAVLLQFQKQDFQKDANVRDAQFTSLVSNYNIY